MLRDIYTSLQNEMVAKLLASRTAIGHSSEKGDATEGDWVEWFNEYLPKRYCVNKAFVVDSEDNISEQIDIVIYDAQYSHLVFRHQGTRYIPAESVYAVFEVKQELNKYNLDYAGDKVESVRKLKRTSVPIRHIGGLNPPNQPHFIPAGILTVSSIWKDPLGATFKKNVLSLKKNKSLQCGCVIQDGAFNINENKKIAINNKEQSLVCFFFDLLLQLQAIGTVTAIDIKAYAQRINQGGTSI